MDFKDGLTNINFFAVVGIVLVIGLVHSRDWR